MLRFRSGWSYTEDDLTSAVFGPMHYLPEEVWLAAFWRALLESWPALAKAVGDDTSLPEVSGWPWFPIPASVAPTFAPMPSGGRRAQIVPDVVLTTSRVSVFVEAELSKDVECEQIYQQLVVSAHDSGREPFVLLVNGEQKPPSWSGSWPGNTDLFGGVAPEPFPTLEEYIAARLVTLPAETRTRFVQRIGSTPADIARHLSWWSWHHFRDLIRATPAATTDAISRRLLLEVGKILDEATFSGTQTEPPAFGVGAGVSERAREWGKAPRTEGKEATGMERSSLMTELGQVWAAASRMRARADGFFLLLERAPRPRGGGWHYHAAEDPSTRVRSLDARVLSPGNAKVDTRYSVAAKGGLLLDVCAIFYPAPDVPPELAMTGRAGLLRLELSRSNQTADVVSALLKESLKQGLTDNFETRPFLVTGGSGRLRWSPRSVDLAAEGLDLGRAVASLLGELKELRQDAGAQ